MAGVSYEEGKKQAYRGFILLGIITIVEVIIALLGNGHLIEGFTITKWIMYPLMIAFSLYKAYFIVNEFMHMRYEVKGLAMSVILPTLLLIWAIFAFLQEGNSWGERREQIKDFNEIDAKEGKQTGSILKIEELESGLRFS
ncbi:MAG: cytochrome C oxidase subunit IV family protein [Saprospiraceae bacterium]